MRVAQVQVMVMISNVIAAGALAILLVGSGFMLSNNLCEKAKVKAELAKEVAIKQAVIHTLEEQKKQAAIDDSISSAYVADLQAKGTRDAELIDKLRQQIPKHQQANSECNLTTGTVSVLNTAARGSNSKVPKPTEAPASSSSAASTVTESAFIKQCNSWLSEYDRLYLQLNALIAWHEQTDKETDK